MTKYNYTKTCEDYLTPPELIEMAFNFFEGDTRIFDLDVCCSDENIPALVYYKHGERNGLKEPWLSFNWCNPLYSQCEKWVKKAYSEQQLGKTTVMLLPVRTETKYWHDYILFNPNVEIKWLRKGYQFINPDTKEPMGVFKNALALVLFIGEF